MSFNIDLLITININKNILVKGYFFSTKKAVGLMRADTTKLD